MELKNTQKMVLAALALSGAAFAQTKAPEPDYTLSFNVGAVTDYRYRGISQTRLDPALQGGADFAHKSGFYAGTWASTIKWIEDGGGDANAEVDLYGGYKFGAGAVSLDVGALRYLYPSSSLVVNPDTTELYIAGTFGPGHAEVLARRHQPVRVRRQQEQLLRRPERHVRHRHLGPDVHAAHRLPEGQEQLRRRLHRLLPRRWARTSATA